MDFLDLKNIAERYLELLNPTSPEKMVAAGAAAGMHDGSRVIDFGCGFGEALALWAERFGIVGIGIDVRRYACERATQKMRARGLGQRVEIVCMNAADYVFEPYAFDAAVCLGATSIWNGFQPTVRRLRNAIRRDGWLIIGEVHWLHEPARAFAQAQPHFFHEHELLAMARSEGFNVEYVIRASHDDWDRYESGNWRGLLAWLREHPVHEQRADVFAHLRDSQDEYFRYGREFLGWAIYVLSCNHLVDQRADD